MGSEKIFLRVLLTLAQLETQDGDRVQRVFRDSPIDQLPPQSRQAHDEAAQCAPAQGMLWVSHNALFAHAPTTSPEQRTASAQDAGLDLPACEPCVSSGTDQATGPQDVAEGTRLSVIGTTAFFINDWLVSGVQTLENFARVIADDLVQAQ